MLVPNTKTTSSKTKPYARVLKEIGQYLVACSIVLLLYFAVLAMGLGTAELIHRFFDGGA